MQPKLPGANCAQCPLGAGGVAVPCQGRGAATALVGEQPGFQEYLEGVPFVGPSGRLLDAALNKHKLRRGQFHITNAVACYSKEKLGPAEYTQAAACCAPRLKEELAFADVIATLGGRALEVMTGKDSIVDWFGYPLPDVLDPERGRQVFPVIHPSAALRKPALLGPFMEMMRKFSEWCRGRRPKPWEWSGWPTTFLHAGADACNALTHMLKYATLIGFDVETGGRDPIHDPLLAVGVASRDFAVSLRWPITDERTLFLLQAVLSSDRIRKAGHNIQHDILALEANGIKVTDPRMDTLLAHVAQYSQLPHNLSFVANIELGGPRWKSDFHGESELKGSEKFTKADMGSLLLYNSRDCYMTVLLAHKQLMQNVDL